MESRVHCHILKSPPLILFPIPISPVHATHCVTLEFIWVLYSCVCLRRQSGIFSSEFIISSDISYICSMLHVPPFLNFVIWIVFGVQCKLWFPMLCNALYPFCIPSPSLRPKYYLQLKDQVSHSYKTSGRIIVLYILVFVFLDSRQEDHRLWTRW
jgi:hypothetical protein